MEINYVYLTVQTPVVTIYTTCRNIKTFCARLTYSVQVFELFPIYFFFEKINVYDVSFIVET
jgi:hypothetical protein